MKGDIRRYLNAWKRSFGPNGVCTSKPPLTGWRRETKALKEAFQTTSTERKEPSQKLVYSIRSKLSTAFLSWFSHTVRIHLEWSWRKICSNIFLWCWYVGWRMDKTWVVKMRHWNWDIIMGRPLWTVKLFEEKRRCQKMPCLRGGGLI